MMQGVCRRSQQWCPCHQLPRTLSRECAMLYLTDSLFIFPPLLLLMIAVACSWGGETVARCVWVEHPNFEEGILPSLPPEATGSDAQLCIVSTICSLERECLTREWLQVRFSLDAMAHLREQVCCQIPDLIVPNEGEVATRAG